MFGSKVKIEPDLLERCRRQAKKEGYSSVEEYVAHVLDKALRTAEDKSADDDRKVEERLKGLGYIE
jgi:hypothetical protein